MAKDSDSKKIDYIQGRVDSVVETVNNIDKEMSIQKAGLQTHLKQDERMWDEFKRMNDILQQNTDSLREHMHQTLLLKEVVMKMDARLSPIEIEYIQKSAVRGWLLNRLKFVAKVGAAGAAIAGAWVYLRPIIEHLLSRV